MRQSASIAFNPALRGTGEGHWREALHAESCWAPAPGPLLVISPHPDDEVMGAGGLIRVWSERGHPVVVLSVTDGEAAYRDWRGLRTIRRGELDQALATLSSRPIRTVRLGLPDGSVGAHLRQLTRALRDHSEAAQTLVAPFEGDGHPDHEAAGLASLAVARDMGLAIVRYPIWAWHHGQPAAFAGSRWGKFPLDAKTQAVKRAALNCFSSQLNPGGSRQPIVPPHVLDYFKRDFEAFLL
jgi:LmbE family N-acetylglucosaminyl deacetylase